MKNWLKELVGNEGCDELEIRRRIHDYVGAWYMTFQLGGVPAVSKFGKPYTAPIPGTPDFGFFFAARTRLIPVLGQHVVQYEETSARRDKARGDTREAGGAEFVGYNLGYDF
jgi:hypothetical protein